MRRLIVVLIMVLAAGCAVADSVTTSSIAAPTTAHSTVSTTEATSTPTTGGAPSTTIVSALLPMAAQEVVASDDGIFLTTESGTVQLWDQPTAIAFMLGDDLVVAQESTPSSVYPRPADGPIRVFDSDGVRSLPQDDENLHLLDAGVADGRRVAVVTSRTGSTPEDTDERLLLVDLQNDERIDLGSVGGWESGVTQGILSDGLVTLVWLNEGGTDLITQSLSGDVVWVLPVSTDSLLTVSRRGDELVLLQTGAIEPDHTPTLTLSRHQLADGDSLGSSTLTLHLADGVHIEGGYCFHGEWLGDDLVCDQTYGGPLLIDISDGTTTYLGAFESGVVTVPRSRPNVEGE
ncbi:MAG: hypothetical protein GXP34_08830 [Actinobacteria bacterium]|nr:hypothetical protein [Actinomycetota bacterium]